MKIRIELIQPDEQEEIIVRCKRMDENVQKLHDYLSAQSTSVRQMVFYKDNEEFYFSLEEILFFETDSDSVYGHTESDSYRIKYRLYELEEMLPRHFLRVSKSTILNVKHIYSIQKNITASSRVQFRNSHKEVFVSRMYYKPLVVKLEERSNYDK